MVYEILNQNDMCEYYDIEKNPGLSQKIKVREGKFAFLDDEGIQAKLISFRDEEQCHVVFYLPQMHCGSCIWLLENLHKLNKDIIKSQVNFLKKEITVVYQHKKISLRKIAELLTSIGYEPHISLNDVNNKKIKKYDRARIYKIGIAGFCFGNIMMLSFPEYFSSGHIEEKGLSQMFSYLNLTLSLPVFFYSASEFFISAWTSLKKKFLNIDAPIAVAVIITFLRSVYEIISGTGAGYLDSMSGIVFFMLIGRYFQDKTYQTLSFDRDYTSYFPLGVTVIENNGTEKQISVADIKNGMRIKVHSHEIIPADAILFMGEAQIDYSFVTGESLPINKSIGEILYAGGKQIGGAIEMEVVKEVSQSYLTQLWNNDSFKQKTKEKKVSFIHELSRYFTYILFSIAFLSALYWNVNDPSKIWNAFTAVLIVACPCALLLSATFTNGNMLRMLQKNNFFAKNAFVLESVSAADTIVFDKTGTLTIQGDAVIVYKGIDLTDYQKQLVSSMANQSNHPLSKAIVSFLPSQKAFAVKNYHELKSAGARANVDSNEIKLGSIEYVTGVNNNLINEGSRVYLTINETYYGYFAIVNRYREHLNNVVKQLKSNYKMVVLSGDNDSERLKLETIFGKEVEMLFDQKPQDKLNFIKKLQDNNRKVIMIGDGLNDAGALTQSDAGIVITDNINNFSPACDAILSGQSFELLPMLLTYCKKEKLIIIGSFIISILYNIVGLYFAVQGTLQPVIAAILMPVSSLSIVLFTTGTSTLFGSKIKKS